MLSWNATASSGRMRLNRQDSSVGMVFKVDHRKKLYLNSNEPTRTKVAPSSTFNRGVVMVPRNVADA